MELRLRELITLRGMTIRAFAEKVGVNTSALPVSESRKFNPTIKVLQTYADALEVPVWELIYDSHAHTIPPYAEKDERPVSERVAKRFEVLLQELHLSKADAARKCGMSAPNLLMTIRNNISTRGIERISAGLGIAPYLLFINNEDYEREMARRRGEVCTVNSEHGSVNNEQLTVNNELRGDGVDVDDTLGKAFPEDLFVHAEEEEPQTITLQDGTYRYDGLIITLRDGKVEIMR